MKCASSTGLCQIFLFLLCLHTGQSVVTKDKKLYELLSDETLSNGWHLTPAAMKHLERLCCDLYFMHTCAESGCRICIYDLCWGRGKVCRYSVISSMTTAFLFSLFA